MTASHGQMALPSHGQSLVAIYMKGEEQSFQKGQNTQTVMYFAEHLGIGMDDLLLTVPSGGCTRGSHVVQVDVTFLSDKSGSLAARVSDMFRVGVLDPTDGDFPVEAVKILASPNEASSGSPSSGSPSSGSPSSGSPSSSDSSSSSVAIPAVDSTQPPSPWAVDSVMCSISGFGCCPDQKTAKQCAYDTCTGPPETRCSQCVDTTDQAMELGFDKGASCKGAAANGSCNLPHICTLCPVSCNSCPDVPGGEKKCGHLTTSGSSGSAQAQITSISVPSPTRR
jgi:hypothetical protein